MPENLGNEELDAFNNNPPRSPADIIANAQANLVVRDGFASFFWHPFLVSDPRAGTAHLPQIVQGIKALGYTFVTLDLDRHRRQHLATFRSPSSAAATRPSGGRCPRCRACWSGGAECHRRRQESRTRTRTSRLAPRRRS